MMAKKIYKAVEADKRYNAKQHDKFCGFDLTKKELDEINKLVSPLIINNGLSPHAVVVALGDKLTISESTLYRLIDSRLIQARNIDLHEKVSRRPKLKKRKNKDSYAVLTTDKKGHMYSDYLDYIATHDVFTVEMDCVEGKKADTAAIMSLHWKEFHMQLYFMLDIHDSSNVVEMLDRIESSLENLDLFRECFPLILTDNGHEFTDIEGMERSSLIPGEKRTHIFFCEPNRSDQKGSCECNHKLLRYIIPKGTSVQSFMQSDMTLVSNHINSYIRKSIGNTYPYDVAMRALPKNFFELLGLYIISPTEVIMKPELLKNNSAKF